MFKPLIIGSRGSPLALIQVKEVLDMLPEGLSHELKVFSTKGDDDKTSSLTGNVGDDFFTNTLDAAILNGDIDIAIHSAKDLPKLLHPKLKILALTKGFEGHDALVGKYNLSNLPAKARIGTSSVLRQDQLLKLYPDITLVDIRGTVNERIALVDQGKVDGIIVAACALKRLKLDQLIQDIFPWEGTPLQGQLAIVGRNNDHEIARLFQSLDVRLSYGKVILAGAGPGDPDLITVKAIKALKKADIVFYDYLADNRLLHYAPQAKHIYVGKRKGAHSIPQAELNRSLKEAACSGMMVVRLKGGDPLIFGRGAEEMEYLQSYHIPVTVIPGISSATGIPADLGVPLTARHVSSSVAFISAHEHQEDDLLPSDVHIPSADTLVFLMGLSKLDHILKALHESGKPHTFPIMIISKGTRIDEQIVNGTLENIKEKVSQSQLEPPALIIAGDVVRFYKDVPNINILYLGTNPTHYRKMGRIFHWPMIDIAPVTFTDKELLSIAHRFDVSDMCIFTSRFAVVHFLKTLAQTKPTKDWSEKTIAAIGTHTADALTEFGLSPHIVSKEETAQGLFKALFSQCALKGKKILFPRSNLPNPFLKEMLITEGAVVDELAIYENVKPLKRDLPDIAIDAVIFTSPSTVRNFLEDYVIIPASWDILAKGPVTGEALKRSGYSYRLLN